MRPIWSGSISFGLVNIPVKLYSATEERALSFNLLHKKDNSPIRYARICQADGKEVPYQDITKGYQYEEGDYVIVNDEDFKKANAKKTKTINIIGFVKEQEIDSVYFTRPYFLEPDKNGAHAYLLLREALKKTKKAGLGKFVLRNKESLGLLKTEKDVILLNQLRFARELRLPDELNLSESEVPQKKEVDMALTLIDQLSIKFEPQTYKDTYTDEMLKIIGAKAKGKRIKIKEEKLQPTQVKDLMATLQASLQKQKVKTR